jgi:hypothetical protein
MPRLRLLIIASLVLVVTSAVFAATAAAKPLMKVNGEGGVSLNYQIQTEDIAFFEEVGRVEGGGVGW